MSIGDKIKLIEKYINEMGKKIGEFSRENYELKQEINLLKEREKVLLSRIAKYESEQKNADNIIKRLSNISKLIDKKLGD